MITNASTFRKRSKHFGTYKLKNPHVELEDVFQSMVMDARSGKIVERNRAKKHLVHSLKVSATGSSL